MDVNKMTDKEYIDYLFDKIDALEIELEKERAKRRELENLIKNK